MDRTQTADAWLTQQFITLRKRTVRFTEARTRIAETERIVRHWFKANGLNIYFKKEPKRGKFYIIITNATYEH